MLSMGLLEAIISCWCAWDFFGVTPSDLGVVVQCDMRGGTEYARGLLMRQLAGERNPKTTYRESSSRFYLAERRERWFQGNYQCGFKSIHAKTSQL